MRPESRFVRALWAPVNLLQFAFTLGWSAFWISVALLARLVTPRAARARVTRFVARRIWAAGLLVGAGARLRVVGLDRLPPGGTHLFVANHSSWIDIAALYRALPIDPHFVAKRELGRVPFLGRFLRTMGMVLVDRSNLRRATDAVHAATALLAAGRSVVSFPEGTRSRDGHLAPFKSAGFGAALAAGCDVVPVALVGAGAVLPAGGFRVRPGTIEVRFGTPIPVADCAATPSPRTALATRAHQAVAELLSAPPTDRHG